MNDKPPAMQRQSRVSASVATRRGEMVFNRSSQLRDVEPCSAKVRRHGTSVAHLDLATRYKARAGRWLTLVSVSGLKGLAIGDGEVDPVRTLQRRRLLGPAIANGIIRIAVAENAAALSALARGHRAQCLCGLSSQLCRPCVEGLVAAAARPQ